MCVSNNDGINNNFRRLEDPNLVFKIPVNTQKDFFEIYRHFGHASSRSFVTPVLLNSKGLYGTLSVATFT
jgi:hypothetical protein